jgi:hypothetical protein
MYFSQSIAATKCRYGNIASRLWSDCQVLWEDSDASTAGHASFLLKTSDPKRPKYIYYKWFYGSTAATDHFVQKYRNPYTFEQDILNEMKTQCFIFDSLDRLKTWLKSYDAYNAPAFTEDLLKICANSA